MFLIALFLLLEAANSGVMQTLQVKQDSHGGYQIQVQTLFLRKARPTDKVTGRQHAERILMFSMKCNVT